MRLLLCLGILLGMLLPGWGATAVELYATAQQLDHAGQWAQAAEAYEGYATTPPRDEAKARAGLRALACWQLAKQDAPARAWLERFRAHWNGTLWAARAAWAGSDRLGADPAKAIEEFETAMGADPSPAVLAEWAAMCVRRADRVRPWRDPKHEREEGLPPDFEQRLARAHGYCDRVIQRGPGRVSVAAAVLAKARIENLSAQDNAAAVTLWLRIVHAFAETPSAAEAWYSLGQDAEPSNPLLALARAWEGARRFPNTPMGRNCTDLARRLESHAIQLRTAPEALPDQPLRLTLVTTGPRVVRLAARRFDPLGAQRFAAARQLTVDAPSAWRHPEPNYLDLLFGRPAERTWTVPIGALAEKQTVTTRHEAPALPRGLWLLSARGEQGFQRADVLVSVGGLSAVSHLDAARRLIMAVDRASGEPIADAEVTATAPSATDRRKVVTAWTGRTGADGVFVAPTAPDDDALISVRRGDDLAYVANPAPGLPPQPTPARWIGFASTDVPRYRPGQTVHYQLVARREVDGVPEIVPNHPCRIEVVGDRHLVLDTR